MFLIFKIEYVLVYPEEGKRMKFTDVTVEGEDTKKRFAQNYHTLHSTGATIIIVILFLQISYCSDCKCIKYKYCILIVCVTVLYKFLIIYL